MVVSYLPNGDVTFNLANIPTAAFAPQQTVSIQYAQVAPQAAVVQVYPSAPPPQQPQVIYIDSSQIAIDANANKQ